VDVVETVVAVADSHQGAAVADLRREVVIVVDVVSFNPALLNWALKLCVVFSLRSQCACILDLGGFESSNRSN